MAKPYSDDLRKRVVAAVEGGLSRRQAASLFDLGISTVVHWVWRFRETGSVAAKPMGGDHRSRLTTQRFGKLSQSAKATGEWSASFLEALGHEHEMPRSTAGKLPEPVALGVLHLGAEQARSHAMSFVADNKVPVGRGL
jgi:transposase